MKACHNDVTTEIGWTTSGIRRPAKREFAYSSRPTSPTKSGILVRLSTRNQLAGIVTEVNLGSVMATVKVKLDGGSQIVTASITKDAVEELGLTVGTAATVLVKSTEVMLAVE